MTKIGVFLPLASRGYLASTTSPATYPSFDLNRTIVQRAEFHGLDFALGMVKFRGFPGPSEYWVHTAEPFTLLSAIAAVTHKIKLYASIPILLLPPAYAAKMTATIDMVAPGRIGVNMVTGWFPQEYDQMGVRLTPSHFARRYEQAGEYATILRQLWQTGRSDFKGEFYQYEDCQLSPRPSGQIEIVGAGLSDKGIDFVAQHGDYNFVTGGIGVNDTTTGHAVVARAQAAAKKHGRHTGVFQLVSVIADRTDELAWAKYEHYKQGVDREFFDYQARQASADSKAAENSTAGLAMRQAEEPEPMKGGLIGSYESVARMLDEIAETPGLEGIMLSFDDFIVGIEQFGEYIQPLMRSRAHIGQGNT